MPVIEWEKRILQRRSSNADSELIGLWMALGIFISIIVFAILLGTFNFLLKNPLKQWRNLNALIRVKDERITSLEGRISSLNNESRAKNFTIDDQSDQIRRYLYQVETKDSALQQRQDRIDELMRLRDVSLARVNELETEVQQLRPRVGELNDQIRVLRRERDERERERDEERDRNAENSKRLAFVTGQLARQRLSPAPSEGSKS